MPHSTPASPGPPRNPPSQHWPVHQPGQDQSDQQHTHGPHNLPNRGKTVSVHGPEEPLIVLGAPVNMSGTVAPVLAELQGRARRAFPATAGPNHALTCQKARGALPGVAGPHTPRSKSNPIHRQGIERWSTAALASIWGIWGHVARVPQSLASQQLRWRDLEWWEHYKRRPNYRRHPGQYNSFRDPERHIAGIAGLNWRAQAQNRPRGNKRSNPPSTDTTPPGPRGGSHKS